MDVDVVRIKPVANAFPYPTCGPSSLPASSPISLRHSVPLSLLSFLPHRRPPSSLLRLLSGRRRYRLMHLTCNSSQATAVLSQALLL